MKKAVIYARFSSEKQNEVSIEGQVRVCTEYAARKGFEIVHEYVDRAVSGKTDKRDAFQRMLRDSETAEWSAVIVYKLDRFARNRIESAINRSTLKKNGVTLISAQEEIPDTPEGVLLESLIEGLNEYYSLELSQKVSRSFYDLRTKGRFLGGRIPYGFKIVDRRYEIDEEQAKKIRFVFSEIEKGARLKDLAKLLEHEPCNWYNVVRNIKCAGCLVHRGEIIEDVIPAIVTRAQFDRVQEILNAQGNTYRPAREYPLADKIFCGVCGNRMRGGVANVRGGSSGYRYYRCDTTRAQGCTLHAIPAEKIEGGIVDYVMRMFASEENRKRIVDAAVRALAQYKDDDLVRTLKARQTRLTTRRDNIINTIAEVGSTEALRAKLGEIEGELRGMRDKIERAQSAEKDTRAALAQFVDNFAKTPPEKLREKIFRDLVERVECFNDDIRVTFRTSLVPPKEPVKKRAETPTEPPEEPPPFVKISRNARRGSPSKPLREPELFVSWDFWVLVVPRRRGEPLF